MDRTAGMRALAHVAPEPAALPRREFLGRAAAAAGAAAILPARVLAGPGRNSPSKQITLGFIGVGTQGMGNLKTFMSQADAKALAVCDVDAGRLGRARNAVNGKYRNQDCGAYNDFREITDRDDIDAVAISTPDHWHVLPAVAAAKAGKDVFCEKPLTLTVEEGRILSDTMQRYGRIFQTASENRSKVNFHRACELVRNGRIGKLHTIRTSLGRGRSARHGQHKPRPVPKGFDYDMWLGQAPVVPYTPARCHGSYRWIFDYSGGTLTDWGAHILDVAQWGNDTEHSGPVSVEGRGVFPKEGLFDTAIDWEVTWKYAKGVTLTCKSGRPKGGGDIRFEGTDGWVFCSWNSIDADPKSILKSVIGADEIHLRTEPKREQRDFLNCVKSGRDTYAPAEIGHRTITLSHIGNISMLLGRKLRWDPERERFLNDERAGAMLSRPMREPWSL
ncbi:MAG: Gfo/Idh/MocA family protein [Planctomycetota bacterium]